MSATEMITPGFLRTKSPPRPVIDRMKMFTCNKYLNPYFNSGGIRISILKGSRVAVKCGLVER